MTFRQLMIAIGLLSLCSLQVCSVAAQENPDEGRSDSQASSVGPMQTNLRITNIRVAPFSAARPGRLLAIRAQITNIGDVTQTARVVVRMSNAADQQGGYIVRVPPKGSRVVHLHARVPTKTDAASRVEFFMTLNRPDTEEDIVLANSKGLPITESYSIRLADDRVTTAVWLDSDPPPVEEWAWPPPKPNYAYEMVIGSRVDGGYTRLLMLLNGELIPCQAADWDAIDTLVISEPSIFRDTIAMKTIRDWVSDGGRVWVMLDKVEPVDVLPLLPDVFSITKIDDTELDRAVVDVDVVAQLSPKDRTIESSDPFKFRRVVQRGGHASHSINGDPAAIWIDFGRGHILLTTLEARAWIKPRIGQPSLNPNYTADFTLQPWAGDLGPEFFSPDRMRSPLADERLDYPMQHIGNPVVSRKVVLSSLAGFLLVLVCAAVGSLRYGALPRFGWAVPFISFTAAVPLIIAALFVRKDIESSSARLQFVEVAPGAQSVHVHEWMATYMGKSDEGKLSSDADARVIWSEQDESQDLRRWVWDDFRRWHISSSDWPIGLWKSQLQYVLPADSLTVHAELDAQGAKLTIPSRLRGSLEDCVLNCTPGNIVLCDKESSGTIRIAAGAPPAGASWIGGALVDDEQMRRQSVYGLMRPKPFGNRYPTYPADGLIVAAGRTTGMEYDASRTGFRAGYSSGQVAFGTDWNRSPRAS
ncbi:MAG: hypothetical protein U0892_16865 [Pirellulales bacterium]